MMAQPARPDLWPEPLSIATPPDRPGIRRTSSDGYGRVRSTSGPNEGSRAVTKKAGRAGSCLGLLPDAKTPPSDAAAVCWPSLDSPAGSFVDATRL